jgi:hypothetical protein
LYAGNGLTVSAGTVSLPANQIDSSEVSFNYAGSTSKGGPATDVSCTDCVALSTETTGNYVAGITAGAGISVSGTAGEGWSPTVAVAFGTDFLGWGNLTNYPAACSAGQAITALGDTPTCSPFLTSESDPQVGAVTNTYVCYGDGSAVQCGDSAFTWDSANDILVVGQINTGQGATEVYLMNQNVRTSDSPTFAGLTLNGNLNMNNYNIVNIGNLFGNGTLNYYPHPTSYTTHPAHTFYSGTGSAWATRLSIGGNAAVVDVSVSNSNFVVNSNQLYVRQSDGKVGIGTTSPARKLHVMGGNITVSNDTVARSDIYWDATNNRLVIQVA